MSNVFVFGEKVGSDSLDFSYDREFVESINEKARCFEPSSDEVNELFLHFYIKIEELGYSYAKNDIDKVCFRRLSHGWGGHVAAALKNKVSVSFGMQFLLIMDTMIRSMIAVPVVFLGGLVFSAALFLLKKKTVKIDSGVAVVRSTSAYEKMKYLHEEGVKFLSDEFFFKKPNICGLGSMLPLREKIKSVFVVPLLALMEFYAVYKDSVRMFDKRYLGVVLLYSAKRIGHKCCFEFCLDWLIRNNDIGLYYTGNKEDRFAVLEERLCSKYSVKSVCIPHGVEYSIIMPAGLPGDVFYCTTDFSRKCLSELYGDNKKYVYDECVAVKMFKKCSTMGNSQRRVVFFSEPRDIGVNIKILKALLGFGVAPALKLHPLDSEDNYRGLGYEFEYIQEFDDAISNNICIARRSTILIEALYNNSLPVCVLVDSKDKGYVESIIPSLRGEGITHLYSFKEMQSLLLKLNVTAAAGSKNV